MVKEIITDLEKLSDRCDEIDVRKENQLMRDIILDLKQTLRENPTGVGLAANQIGYDKRIFVINFNGDIRTFINPVISQVKGFTLNRESCLSLPGKSFIRPRHNEIMVIYQTPLGKTESRKIVGLAAYVFQHELDHLDGLTLADIGLEVGEDFDKATEEEKNEVINAYLDSLDIKQKQLEKEIEEDEDLKQASNAIKFMEALQKGEVELDGQETVKKSKEE
jgi:peptide deformylase